MKTPTWGYVIGVLMMLFGGCSVNSNLQSIYTPNFLELPKEIFKGVSDSLQKTANNLQVDSLQLDSLNIEGADSALANVKKQAPAKLFKNVGDAMEKMFYMSEFTKTWMVRFGYMGLVVAVIYILGGLFLMIPKSFSLKVAIGSLVFSIVFHVIQSIVLSSDGTTSIIAMAAGFSKIFGIILDIILLVVVLASDKSGYKNEINNIDSQLGQI